jgi:TonB-linked SusC/RagA family outer membrane protein
MKRILLILSVFLVFLSLGAQAQNLTVTGTVTGKDDGLPLAGVSVVVKGTSIATLTGANGKFSINVPAGKKDLVFSYIGFLREEVLIGSSTSINVALKTDSKLLSEVVVTGVGVATSKRKLGFNVQSIKTDGLPSTPTASIDQALVGNVAGAQISSISGNPGSKTNIVLRGINTVQNSTTPIILLDGVQLGTSTDISSIDPSTIDRIEVIAGSAASTIYGAQGANGVIQVFSKKGKQGKPRISFSSSLSSNVLVNIGGVHQATLHSFATDANNNLVNSKGVPLTLNADGTLTGLAWQFPAGSFVSAQANPGNISNKPYNANFPYFNHLGQIFQNAIDQNANINISGANGKTDYLVGYGITSQQSPIKGAGSFSRMNFTSNIGTELFKGFTIRSNTQLIYTLDQINPYFDGTGNSGALYSALNTSPFFDFNHKLADGTYPYRLNATIVSVNGANPFYYEEYSSQQKKVVDLVENLNANYKINHFVELDAKYGLTYDSYVNRRIYQNQSANINALSQTTYIGPGSDNTGALVDDNNNTTFQNLLVSAFFRTDFQKDFHSRFPITTSTEIAYDYRKNREVDLQFQGNQLPPYAIYNMAQTKVVKNNTDQIITLITYGGLVNQRIEFGDYGGVSGGVRSDFSSAFGSSQAFTFPRLDGYIRPSSFGFWKNGGLGNAIPELKFRAAWGKAGTQPQPFDKYITLSTGNVGTSLGFSIPQSSPNPNLKPEVETEFETGTDFTLKLSNSGAFSSLNFSGTYWNRNVVGAIYNINSIPSGGTDGIKTNAINLGSHGFELSLNVEAITSKKFTWNFVTNFNKQTTTITAINGPNIITATSAGSTALTLAPGQKIGQIFGFKALTSLDYKNQEGVAYIDPSQYANYSIVNGRVVNNTTKGIQFTNESYSFGDPNPKFNMSLTNTFTFFGLATFSFQFDWVNGSHLYNQTKEWMYRDGISGDYTVPVNIAGTNAAYEAYYRSAYADFFGAQNGARNSTKDYFYEDASFLRLRNVSAAIDLAKVIKGKLFNRVQLILSGRNVWTLTKYSGFDPEISSGSQGSAFDRGVDHSSIPNARTYSVGLNIGL